MTTYETTAVPGQLTPPAPLDPTAVHQLARHALDVLMPAATGPRDQDTALGEAAGQLAIALCSFARLVETDTDNTDDQLTEGEDVVGRLRRASHHVHEHMAATVPAAVLEARSTGLVDSCLEEGLPVVGSLSAELLLAGGRSATVRLTHETAHQDVELEDGRGTRVPAADHLIVRDGLHELARLLAPLAEGRALRPAGGHDTAGQDGQAPRCTVQPCQPTLPVDALVYPGGRDPYPACELHAAWLLAALPGATVKVSPDAQITRSLDLDLDLVRRMARSLTEEHDQMHDGTWPCLLCDPGQLPA